MLPKKGYYIPRAREMDMVPSIWNNFSETTIGTEKWHGVRLKTYKVFFINRKHIAIYKESEWKAVGKYILNRFLKQPSYFKKIWKANKDVGNQTQKLASKVVNNLTRKTPEELLKSLLVLKKQWIAFDQINIMPWYLGAEPLREYLTSKLLNEYKVNEKDIEILFNANKLTLATEEELEVYRAALLYLLKGDLVSISSKLSKEFGWVPFGYDGPTYWNSTYYAERVKKAAKIKSEVIKKKLVTVQNKLQSLILFQNKLIKHYKLDSNLKRLLDIQQKLYVMTDERKKVHFNTNIAYHKVLEQLQKPSGLTLHELKYLDAEEVVKMFKYKAFEKYKQLSNSRQNTLICGYTVNGVKEYIISGKKVEKMFAKYTYNPVDSSEVIGMVASKVGNSITKGIVRKITNPREMSKMKKGEILVTWMTTPDFVPAMRMAKAIVTDEGGITSHAAIVSRELGIPCIIGTKIATKVFKDGDMVEVDANKGVVRKIKEV